MSPHAARKMGTPPAQAGRIHQDVAPEDRPHAGGLAQALSVTFSTVSRWENGHVRPSKLAWKAIEQLATERGAPLGDGEDGEDKSE
jgi:transcriptional regulator with XRE-family HTH domain